MYTNEVVIKFNWSITRFGDRPKNGGKILTTARVVGIALNVLVR